MTQTENLTILFTDMVGYTERTARQSREQNQAMLRDLHRLLRPLIPGFGGRFVKSIGDALLATFRSPTDAVRCGMAMHDAMAEYNAALASETEIHVRVAINVGEVRLHGRDLFGEAVNVAARVEGLTPPDEIYLTEAVYLAMNKAEVATEPLGEHRLKGIPEVIRLYRVPPRVSPRLMAPADTLPELPQDLPFGGIHRTAAPAGLLDRLAIQVELFNPGLTWTRLKQGSWTLWAAGGLAVAAILGTGAYWMGQELPSAEYQYTEQNNAREVLLTGHLAYAHSRRPEAVAAYAQALALDASLANDADLVANLVGCLSWAAEEAMPVIRQHPSPAMLDALARRTAEPGRLGASRAARLLEELKAPDRIDRAGMAIVELSEQKTCEGRLKAVKELRRMRDPRALPVLRQHSSGLQNWFSNGCLLDEANAAIQEIQKAAKS